jgi:hypothetical protein
MRPDHCSALLLVKNYCRCYFFYLYLIIHLIYFKKIIIDFTIIYFINKENLNTTYNFKYLNKYFK